MDTNKIFNCLYCKYTSNRKFNLKIHEINKHSKEILNEFRNSSNEFIDDNEIIDNNEIIEENVNLEENEIIETKQIYHCSKCSKEYSTIKYLNIHEEKCIGISILTCPKCFKVFSNRFSKSVHIINNKCKAKPIINEKVYIEKKILEEKDNEIKEKDNEIKLLKNAFLKNQKRKLYNQNNVIYMLTTKDYKEKRIYIIGKTKNLTNRLSVYNKTIDHEVVYYRECKNEDAMDFVEKHVLYKLNNYKEAENRERVILPIDKDISYFISIIDECINSS